jgi:hypothetical protein
LIKLDQSADPYVSFFENISGGIEMGSGCGEAERNASSSAFSPAQIKMTNEEADYESIPKFNSFTDKNVESFKVKVGVLSNKSNLNMMSEYKDFLKKNT